MEILFLKKFDFYQYQFHQYLLHKDSKFFLVVSIQLLLLYFFFLVMSIKDVLIFLFFH
nr:MAG TPA: hypothetical protein [Bacteriophage sp.]